MKIQGIKRNQLWHGSYRYSLGFNYDYASFIRGFDSDAMRLRIARYNRLEAHWNKPNVIESFKILELDDMMAYLSVHRAGNRIAFSNNKIDIFSNDLTFLGEVVEKYCQDHIIKEAILALPKGVISLRKPRFKYRSYLRDSRIDHDKYQRLLQMISGLGPAIDINPTWRRDKRFGRLPTWSHRTWFLEYDDPGIETMIRLIYPELIRKTMPLEYRDK